MTEGGLIGPAESRVSWLVSCGYQTAMHCTCLLCQCLCILFSSAVYHLSPVSPAFHPSHAPCSYTMLHSQETLGSPPKDVLLLGRLLLWRRRLPRLAVRVVVLGAQLLVEQACAPAGSLQARSSRRVQAERHSRLAAGAAMVLGLNAGREARIAGHRARSPADPVVTHRDWAHRPGPHPSPGRA